VAPILIIFPRINWPNFEFFFVWMKVKYGSSVDNFTQLYHMFHRVSAILCRIICAISFLQTIVKFVTSKWVSRVQRPHQHIVGHFGDKSFQSITCTGTDNLTRTIKRQNTQITQPQKESLVNSTTHNQKKPRLRDRTDRAWYSRFLRHPARKRSRSILTTPEPARG